MNKLRVIITGASGMVGEGVLQECLQNENVEKILVITRKHCGYEHPKLHEILHKDFFDIKPLSSQLTGYDACYFCLGGTSLGVTEEEYSRFTYTLTLGFAATLAEVNPQMTFCYVSGAGTDSSENGKLMWARVKGKTENDLMRLSFKAVYNFRPGFMRPVKGAKNIKSIFRWLDRIYPVLRWINKTYFLTLEEVGRAMISVTLHGYSKTTLEVKDISILANR